MKEPKIERAQLRSTLHPFQGAVIWLLLRNIDHPPWVSGAVWAIFVFIEVASLYAFFASEKPTPVKFAEETKP